MHLKATLSLLFLIPCVFSQNVRSYDWRTREGALSRWPDPSSLRPYSDPEPSSHHYPEDVISSYGDDSASYSREYQPPYAEVPQSLSPYQSYHGSRDEELNMTVARYGGFGGTGDAKGFGAYDFPKHAPHSSEEFDHPEPPRLSGLTHSSEEFADPEPFRSSGSHRRPAMDPEIEDLMRLSKERSRGYHLSREPVLGHPL